MQLRLHVVPAGHTCWQLPPSQVKLRVPAESLDTALGILRDDGFSVRRNGIGVIVDVAHGDKARPIHVLSAANIQVVDFVHLSDIEVE